MPRRLAGTGSARGSTLSTVHTEPLHALASTATNSLTATRPTEIARRTAFRAYHANPGALGADESFGRYTWLHDPPRSWPASGLGATRFASLRGLHGQAEVVEVRRTR